MKRKILLIQAGLLMISIAASAQRNHPEAGGKLINELADWRSYGPGAGVQVVYKFSQHSGIESGVYYKINPKYYMYPGVGGNPAILKFNEQVIRIPFLYRFESTILNFTAGGAVDYFLNLRALEKNPPLGLFSSYYNRLELVSSLAISKTFYLNESLLLEPELQASAFVPAGGGGLALNISLRKKIF